MTSSSQQVLSQIEISNGGRFAALFAAADIAAGPCKENNRRARQQQQQQQRQENSDPSRQQGSNLNSSETVRSQEIVVVPKEVSLEASNVDSNVSDLSLREEQKRIRRLMSVFRLWRTRTEMSLSGPDQDNLRHHQHLTLFDNNESNLQEAERRCRQHDEDATRELTQTSSTNSDNNNNILHASTQPIIYVPSSCVGSQIHFTPSLAGETLRETKRLWQNLVLPLVLGCIIFLLVVWTKQISLVLLNDTIVMVIILGAVFIIMSALAFWLAQDQQFQQNQTQVGSEEEEEDLANNHHLHHHQHHCASIRRANESSQHLESYCQRHLNHHHRNNYNQQQQRYNNLLSSLALSNGARRSQRRQQQQVITNAVGDDGSEMVHKCCDSISIIDCHPPDYYSAIEHSYPVSLAMGSDIVKLDLNEEENQTNNLQQSSCSFAASSQQQSSSANSDNNSSSSSFPSSSSSPPPPPPFVELEIANLSNCYEHPPSYDEYFKNNNNL